MLFGVLSVNAALKRKYAYRKNNALWENGRRHSMADIANGSKNLFIVVALVSIVGAGYMPLNQRINSMEKQIAGFNENLNDHEVIEGHPGMLSIASTIKQALIGSEGKSGDLQRRVLTLEEWRTWWNRTVQPTDVRQDDRINSLERVMGLSNKSAPAN